MNKSQYECPYYKISFFQLQDIITNSSTDEDVDDLGSWNDNWFANKNG